MMAWKLGEAWWQILLFSVLENNKRQSRDWGGWWWSQLLMAHYPASSGGHSSQYHQSIPTSNILTNAPSKLKILKHQLLFKGLCQNRWQYFAILRMCSCVFCNCRDGAGIIRWRVPIISRPGPRSPLLAADSWATPGNFATCKKVAKYCRPTT